MPTVGHQWMIETGAKLFDNLIVAIGTNPAKKTMFSVPERLKMLFAILPARDGVVMHSYENKLLVHYAREMGAGYILRGIRDQIDANYERQMQLINSEIAPEIETIFLMPPANIAQVSSSIVKGLIGVERWEEVVKKYLPPPIWEQVVTKHRTTNAASGREKL
jgi:pantetheine-phosphate adenylyltransferase